MSALKIWNGTAWETVSQSGPPGTAPVTSVDARTGAVTLSDLYVSSVDGRRGAVSLSDLYVSATDPLVVTNDWIGFTPKFATENDPSGAGMTPGAGGSVYGAYRFIAPYTMAIRMRFNWGSSGGNGGTGFFIFGLPPGYSTSIYYSHQYLSDFVARGDGLIYEGIAFAYANDIWMRPNAPHAGLTADLVTSQQRVGTGGTTHPPGFYPNGALGIWGVLNTAQRS